MDKVVYYSKRWACLHLSLLKALISFHHHFYFNFDYPLPYPVPQFSKWQPTRAGYQRTVLCFGPCPIAVPPAVGWRRVGTLTATVSCSISTTCATGAPDWPLSPIPVYLCTEKIGLGNPRLCSSWSDTIEYFSCNTTPQIKDDLF